MQTLYQKEAYKILFILKSLEKIIHKKLSTLTLSQGWPQLRRGSDIREENYFYFIFINSTKNMEFKSLIFY